MTYMIAAAVLVHFCALAWLINQIAFRSLRAACWNCGRETHRHNHFCKVCRDDNSVLPRAE